MHRWLKCLKMLIWHLSLSVWVFVGCFSNLYICYNFIHHCDKFQTGKIKLLPENHKKNNLCVFSSVNIWYKFFVHVYSQTKTLNISCVRPKYFLKKDDTVYFYQDCKYKNLIIRCVKHPKHKVNDFTNNHMMSLLEKIYLMKIKI